MDGKIRVQKSLLMWFAVLVMAIIASGYIVFTAMPKTQAWSGTDVQKNRQNPSVQEVRIRALSNGEYDKPEITVKKGIPVRLHFSADQNAGCGRAMILDGFNIRLTSRNGETQVAEFTPTEEGVYAYHCGMNMFRGRMIVVP